jgi:uncharacterized membrane protein YesL
VQVEGNDSPAPLNARRSPLAAGPLRLAFTRAFQDWWYGLIPFAVMNFAWLVLVITIVAGPPATAAMMAVARDAAIGQGGEPGIFFLYLRRFFWRAWALGLITFLGTLILLTDLSFYSVALSDNPLIFNVGVFFLLYVLVVWLEFLLIAWPLLVDRPDMSLGNVMRNAAILTLKKPGANLGLALIVLFLSVISIALAVAVALVLAALVSLLAQHYLNIQAPMLANFPLRPGIGVVPPEADEE